MEASLLTVAPAPISPQPALSQSTQTTDGAAPFTAFLSKAINTTNKESEKETTSLDSEASTSIPNYLEMFMAGEQTALSLEDIPELNSSQLGPENNIITTLTNINDASPSILFAPGDLKQLQTMLSAKGQTVSSLAPEATETMTFDLKQLQTMLSANGQAISSLAPEATETIPFDLKQLQTMLAAKGQTVSDVPPEATELTIPTHLNKTETLLTRQLQTILTGDSQATFAIRTPYQSAPAESLNGLSSPYIQSVDSAAIASILPAHVAMKEGAIDGTKTIKTTEAGEGIRQNVEEQYLNARLDGLADKNNAKNQRQDTGQQENGTNQQNTANTVPSTALSNNEQTGQSFIATLGTQATAPIQGATPATHPATLSPGAPVAAEEIINNLVQRFSINPRLQTSKISLNLNPAELGALKIDILVKGDSIKAHIAVNSQQIQETIEKNMPKLRAILEEQGFNIEDFQVSMESTTSDSNHFFQQQFSSRQDSAQQTTLARDETSFDLSMSSAEEILSASMDSGINLSI